MFTGTDISQIEARGAQLPTIEKQISCFIKGFPYINLHAPAKVNNGGIDKLEENEITKFSELYEQNLSKVKALKFVPASGAASRMFMSLFTFRGKYDGSDKEYMNYLEDNSFNSVFKFFNELEHFAFYNDLTEILKLNRTDIKICLEQRDFNTIIDFLLLPKGLNYSALPKGLLKFHSYGKDARTAFEEHLVEGAAYARNVNDIASLHFTVSPEHIERFKALVIQVVDQYKKTLGIQFDISFSVQKSSTDTIAVDMNNQPFREEHGSILFRPGGHGALLENLNELDGDVIFIKNIDNIVPDRLKADTIKYKKALAGFLLNIQNKLHEYLRILAKGMTSEEMLTEILTFSNAVLKIPTDHLAELNKLDQVAFLYSKLNRPIRVCGMVRNQGEPGGGPFWVKNSHGEISLQIVESSQVDIGDDGQKEIFNSSTHFNPVDLVCGVKDFKGEKFNLMNYTDPDTGFISIKSKDGKMLKAMELPGLWNGAMANWISIFVEVPISTFNPVKTVNDLLREEHQG